MTYIGALVDSHAKDETLISEKSGMERAVKHEANRHNRRQVSLPMGVVSRDQEVARERARRHSMSKPKPKPNRTVLAFENIGLGSCFPVNKNQ